MTDHTSPTASSDATLRAIFSGRRGRLLMALLVTEFGAAVQSVAYSSVLPITSRELDGGSLYGATLVAGSFTTILVLAAGAGPFGRLGPTRLLLLGTVLYLGGVLFAVTAVSMVWVLAGMVLRGLAGGLLAGLGLTAIGALYKDALRVRVLGIFAVVWLLPSLVGPAFSAAITIAIGWRAAMAWPAVVVLVGRLLIGRHAGIIPWRRSKRRLDLGTGIVLLIGLALAATAPAVGSGWGISMLIAGMLVAVGASARVLWAQVQMHTKRLLTTVSLFGLCLAFFGGSGIISLAVIEGLERGVVASSIAVGAGLVAWSLTGIRPPKVNLRVGDTAVIGMVVLSGSLALVFATQTGLLSRTAALLVLLAAWAFAGLGMGLSYPQISAEAMNDLPPDRVAGVATAVAFAETSGTAVGALLGGGTYSLASASRTPAHTSIGWAFLLLTAVAAATLAICIARRRASGHRGAEGSAQEPKSQTQDLAAQDGTTGGP